jgi:hypothetical protein
MYSVVEEFVPIGEVVDCLLLIPGGHATAIPTSLGLRCTARVVHITEVKHGMFGIGMCIVEYSVIPRLEQALAMQAG